MPVHDWTRVDAGVFHDFHNVWIALLRIALNSGLLPQGFYAMSEQHGGKYIADVLTLHEPSAAEPPARAMAGSVSAIEAPPKVRRQLALSPAALSRRKTLTIRHVGGDRIVALLEIVSPANKDRKNHVEKLVNKMEDALSHGIHLLVVDLFPPGKHDPLGLHGELWDRMGGDEPEGPPADERLTLASYVADTPMNAYLEYISVGSALPEMPLFLDPEFYVKPPLEATYQAAWQSTPERWRRVLEPPAALRRRKRGRQRREMQVGAVIGTSAL